MIGPRRPRWAPLATVALTVALIAIEPASAADRAPRVSATSAILLDARDGHVLYRRRAADQRAIASATKLMTALVAIDELPLARRVRAVRYTPAPAESRIDLRPGERMAVSDLMRALLLESANDAAQTLAVRAAGSEAAFVAQMNERGRALGLARTSFANPIGLDAPANHSSARDLATIARRVLANDFLAATVDMPRARLTTGARTRVVANRNRLVGRYPFVDGVKTGHTQNAGYVLVGAAKRKGARLVSVVLGAPSEAARDADTLALLRYGFSRYRRVPAVRRGAPLARAQVANFGDKEARLVAARRVSVTARRGQRVRTVVEAPDEVSGPLAAGARVGTVRVYRANRLVRAVPLVTAAAVPEAGIIRKLGAFVVPVLLIAAGLAIWLAVRRRRAPRVPMRRPAGAE